MVVFGKKKKSFPSAEPRDNVSSPSMGSLPKSMSSAFAKMISVKSLTFRGTKVKEFPGSPVAVNQVAESQAEISDEDIFKLSSESTCDEEIVHHSVKSLPPLSANMRALEARTFGAESPAARDEGRQLPDRLEKKSTPRGTLAPLERLVHKDDSSLSGHWMIESDSLTLGKTIGHSSFGAVTEGMLNGTRVAVKTIPRDLRPGAPSNLNVIKKEAELNCQLRHPNIVLFMGISVQPDKVCIVTELMSRGNVRDLLLRVVKGSLIRLDWSLRQQWALDTAQGMAYLHSHNPPMIHRDLKTTNLLVDRGMNVKICDFGLSRFRSDQLMSAVGTVHFAAPEVLRNEHYTEKADVFSFGTVMWELYARKPVFKGMAQIEVYSAVVAGKMPEVGCDCEPRFKNLIQRCWSTDPGGRPSFREIIDILGTLVDETPDEEL